MMRLLVSLLRFLATWVCNLRILWITLLLITIVNIHFAIRASDVNTELCHWYWGTYSQYTDDDYLNSLSIDSSGGSLLAMTCNFYNCTDVCAGNCDTFNYYGNTETGNNFSSEYPVCTIYFRYLNIAYALLLLSLSLLSFVELLVGIHMLRVWYYPSSPSWWFLKNWHLQSIFTSMLFAFRPGFYVQYLLDDSSEEIYPSFGNVVKVPYYFEILLSLVIDGGFLVTATLWILFSQEDICIFLYCIALINFLLTTVRLIYRQFLLDLKEFQGNAADTSDSPEVSGQVVENAPSNSYEEPLLTPSAPPQQSLKQFIQA